MHLLAQTRTLRLISLTHQMDYSEASRAKFLSAANENADYILDGSVRFKPGGYDIVAKLTDAYGQATQNADFLSMMEGRGFRMLSLTGAGVAARQSWLQWFPPEVATCGRDLFGMIESFPLRRVIPMLFRGSGDCSAVDWTFLGLTIANWSFLNFMLIMALCLGVLAGAWRARG